MSMNLLFINILDRYFVNTVIQKVKSGKGNTMLRPKYFAKKIGMTVKTLQIWDNDGTLK